MVVLFGESSQTLKNQYFYKQRSLRLSLRLPVIWLGLEPKTYCLEGSCSIQLSYQTEKSFSENRLQR